MSDASTTESKSTADGAQPKKPRLRQLPALMRHAIRISWTAGRSDLLLSTALQMVGGVSIVVLLLIGRGALEALLGAVTRGGTLADVLPWTVAMAVVAAGQFFASSLQRERQHVLGELVGRYMRGSGPRCDRPGRPRHIR